MKNYNLLSMLGLGLILFGSWGCAKDQTVAEYDNAQAAKQAAQNLPAVALWVGPITGSDGSTVGMIQLNLQNQTNTVATNDNTNAEQTILTGQIQVANVPNSDTQIASATFTPDSDNASNGNLAATITAQDASLNAQTLTLSATISGNQMTGQIQAENDPPLIFIATKGASPSSQNLVITSKRAQFESQTYFSTFAPISMGGNVCGVFDTPLVDVQCEAPGGCAPSATPPPTAVTCGANVEMAIIENSPHSEVNFFNVFTDQPTVQVDLDYYVPLSIGANANSNLGQTISADDLFVTTHIQFSAVTWNLDNNKLLGNGTTANGETSGTSRLDCTAASTPKGQGWSCNINNDGTNSPTAVLFGPGQLASGQN